MSIKEIIEEKNAEAVRRIVAGDPVLVDLARAGDLIPALSRGVVFHSGPPVDWASMSGAQRGSVIGSILFEGWADDQNAARQMAESGQIKFEPNHGHAAVGPMAGTITESMWLQVVENRAFGNRAYCRQVEPAQQFGDYSPKALKSLVKWRDVWAPTIKAAVVETGGIELKPIITKALQMGDELHNRPNAASSLFANAVAAPIARSSLSAASQQSTLEYLAEHFMFFLGLSMASAKSATDPAAGVETSTIVTAMARNGTEFGIQVSGLKGEWFTAPAPRVEGLFLAGYSEADAGLDTGDSAITECVGWGGFALAGATGLLGFVGGSPDDATNASISMREITNRQSPDYLIPSLGFEGTAVGIDIRKVVQTGIVPVIDTAMIHREEGHPIIGGGMVRPPMECFTSALKRLAEVYDVG